MKQILTIGYLHDVALKSEEGKPFSPENMSSSAEKAYRGKLLHLIPSTLPESDFVGISFGEEDWRGRIVESRMSRAKPQKIRKRKDLANMFWRHGEYGFKDVFPVLMVNTDYAKTKYIITKFRNTKETKKFMYSIILANRQRFLENIKYLGLEEATKLLQVSVEDLKHGRYVGTHAESVWEDYCKKFIRPEEISGVKVLLIKYPRKPGYRIYWPHDTLVFSVYDYETKDEFRRGLILLNVYVKNRDLLVSK